MNIPLTQQIEALKRDLDLLRETDKTFRVFGADSHQYELGPTWSEGALREFEAEYRCSLPEEYRLFLKHIGDGIERHNGTGGAGPHYGLYPLEAMADRELISLSFPMDNKGQKFCASFDPNWPQECPASVCQNNPCQFLHLREEAIDWETSRNGLLNLFGYGCGWEGYLVITGPARGTIWSDLPDGLCTENETFLQWYQKWLVNSLQKFRNESLVELIDVGMTRQKLIEIMGQPMNEHEQADQCVFLEYHNVAARFLVDEAQRVVKIERYPWM